jgi:histidine kinase
MPHNFFFSRFSLTLRSILIVLLVLVLSVGTLYFIALKNIRSSTMNGLADSADAASLSLARNVVRLMLAQSGGEEVRSLLDERGGHPNISAAALRDKAGMATMTAPRENEGAVAGSESRECQSCHRQEPPTMLASFMREEGGATYLTVVRAMPARKGCFVGSCHAGKAGQSVLGTLSVEVPVSRVLNDAVLPVRQSIAVTLSVMMLGVTGFAAWISRRVTTPCTRIAAALKDTSAGTSWTDLETNDAGELRELAVSVNAIAQSVRWRQQNMDENLSMYQSLFDGVPCLITVQDRDLRLIRYNKLFWEHFGAKPADHCFRVYKGRDLKCVNCPVEKTFLDGKSHTTEEKGFYKDGTPAHWIVRTAPVHNSEGEITAVMEMSLDITQHKELEEKLKKSERTYSTIFDNIPVVVFELNAHDLVVRNCNRKMSQLYGYCKGEVIGKPFTQLFAHGDMEAHAEDIRNQKRIAQATHIDKEDKEFFVSMDLSRTSLNGDDILLAVVRDVTDRIRTEQQVIHSSKMATLGEMAAGVAHELNQPLAVLKMVANFFVRKLRRDESPSLDDLRHMTNKIVGNVDRATKIIEHMREFGRKPNLESSPVFVNEVMQRACDFFSEQLKIRDIIINWELDPQQPAVLADPNRLEQVFINLLVNARDAIDDKCSERQCTQRDRIITMRTRSNARHVVAEVVDTGPGIPKDVVPRIFEPFFSTKEVGRGTGLGLSICYDIITDYDGTIHAFSKPGHGARFVVSLPIAESVRPGTQ